jgi:hypothetical protein
MIKITSILIVLLVIVLGLSWFFHVTTNFSTMPDEVITFLASLLPTMPDKVRTFLAPLFSNILTEIIGIIITLWCVDRILARRERDEEERRAKGGLRKAKKAFDRLIEPLGKMILGCLEEKPVPEIKSISKLFCKHFTTHLSELDLSAESEEVSINFGEFIIKKYDNFSDHISQIILTYGPYLEMEYHEVLDELYDCEYFLQLKELKHNLDKDKSYNPKLFMNNDRHKETRGKFFCILIKAIKLHNLVSKDGKLKIKLPLLPQDDEKYIGRYRL